MEFQLSYPNPKRWCCESATLNMPANLENSAVAIGLEKVSFNSHPKDRPDVFEHKEEAQLGGLGETKNNDVFWQGQFLFPIQ